MHTDGEPSVDLIRGWHPPPMDDNVWSADLPSYIQTHSLETQGKQTRKSGRRTSSSSWERDLLHFRLLLSLYFLRFP